MRINEKGDKMTKINQFARQSVDKSTEISELSTVGFYDAQWENNIFNYLIRRALPEHQSISSENGWLAEHLATPHTSVLDFLTRQMPLTETAFYTIAAQLLGFDEELIAYGLDGRQVFQTVGLEMVDISDIYHAWYVLLNTHTKNGLLFIDDLASHGYFELTNKRLIFNGKSLPTYDTKDLIQETVWVETSVDSDQDGQFDLVQVDIQRPKSVETIPILLTASPYYQGMMIKESDAKVHDVNKPLKHKLSNSVVYESIKYQNNSVVQNVSARVIQGHTTVATKKVTTLAGSAWDLNNYFLSRGYAVAYASGVGTRHSDGMQDTGSPEQVESMKNVVEWLAGNRVAFTDRDGQIAISADWSNHNIAMTGRSYLGTLATAVATTGVAGLKTVVSEAAISDWYQYYRDNGLVVAPGGFPGEDMDVLAELVYSRIADTADCMRTQKQWQNFQTKTVTQQDRQSGNYNRYWDARNYLNQVENIKIDMLLVHGLNDWNVKPRQVYRLWQAINDNQYGNKLILHQGQHINISNNRSLDFADQINLWFSKKLLGINNHAEMLLPNVIWQDNTSAETWHQLREWGTQTNHKTYNLAPDRLVTERANSEASFTDYLPETLFKKYTKDFNYWREKAIEGASEIKPTQLSFKSEILEESWTLSGEPVVHLRVKTSQNIGLISVMLVDYGDDNYLKPHLTSYSTMIDRGMNFAQTNLNEFEMKKSQYKMISIGHTNLQNRTNAWQNDDLVANEYVTLTLKLQPTLYTLRKGHQIGLILYATDFEMTLRGNQNVTYTIDYGDSTLILPGLKKLSQIV